MSGRDRDGFLDNERSSKDRLQEDRHELPEDLRWSLRDLRRDASPSRDLWPDVAARIASLSRQHVVPADTSARPATNGKCARTSYRAVGWALAASVLLAVGAAWQLRPGVSETASTQAPENMPTTALMVREADSMTRDYQVAWRALDAQRDRNASLPDGATTALRQLDDSAAQIRAALREYPDSRFLFDRLQNVYSRRLEVAQRLTGSAT